MGPVGRQESCIGDECTLDGTPGIRVLGLKERPDEDRCEQKEEETIEQDFPPVGEFCGKEVEERELHRKSLPPHAEPHQAEEQRERDDSHDAADAVFERRHECQPDFLVARRRFDGHETHGILTDW